MIKRNLQTPLLIATLLFSATSLSAYVQTQDNDSRQIVLDEFTKARPTKAAARSPQQNPSTSKRSTARVNSRPTYRRASSPITLTAVAVIRQPGMTEELGITMWRLRQTRESDSGARLLVMDSAQPVQWTPERIQIDTPLNINDRVRLSVESPRVGYLYVIDREQYADGTLGDAYLIFPTQRTRGGDNKVEPGKLIDIPAQEDNPSYLTLVPSPGRRDQVAEVLTFIVTPQPLDLPISSRPIRISRSDVSQWERQWASETERFEMEGGAGLTWTNEEKAASATASARLLTQEEPAPQTVYRIGSKGKTAILVTVPLRYVR